MVLNVKIISLNARGLKDDFKRRQLFKIIREKNADIALLQETHCTKEVAKIWESEWAGKMIHSYGTSGARGVSILFKR